MPARTAVISARLTLRDTILSLGPVAYWPLTEGNARDLVGARHGTPSGTYSYGGEAVDVDGPSSLSIPGDNANGLVTVSAAGLMVGRNPFTLLCLVNQTSQLGVAPRVWESGLSHIVIRSAAAGITFQRSDGTTTHALVATAMTTGVSHLVALTYDGTSMIGYLDGAPAPGRSWPYTSTISTGDQANATIGNTSGASRSLSGRMGHVAIFNRALTAAEVGAIYAASRG